MIENLDTETDATLIAGPTASGKSALALEIAQRRNGVVINADSMQVYRNLQITTARPSVEEMAGIEHCLYGHVDGSVHYSTGRWLADVSAVLARLRAENRHAVIVGGTGLYFKSLFGGLSSIPEIPAEIRQKWRNRQQNEPAAGLHKLLEQLDPASASVLKPNDGQRIVRALEVVDATGQSIRSFTAEPGSEILSPSQCQCFVLMKERNLLNSRIADRFRQMMESGAISEVEKLMNCNLDSALPIMKAIGVPEISHYVAGVYSYEQAIEKAAISTRQFAKRQRTWFRNQLDDRWMRIV